MLLEFLIALLLTGGIVYGIFWFIWWIKSEEDTYKLSFKQFHSFYIIAPNKWDLRDDYVYLSINGRILGEKYEFRSFFDYLRYKRFKRKVEKNKKQQEAIQSQQKLIDEMKKVIAEEERKNQQWTQDKLHSNHKWRQNKSKSNSDY
jgi:hypothetical protein